MTVPFNSPLSWFQSTEMAVLSVASEVCLGTEWREVGESYLLPYPAHGWVRQIRHVLGLNRPVHPAVHKMLELGHAPTSMHQLVLECPYVSIKDAKQLAYVRDDASGRADKQTITSPGKYLARHWPHVPDHVRRDALLIAQDELDGIKWLVIGDEPDADASELVRAIENGPQSCMHRHSQYNKTPWADWVRRGGKDRVDLVEGWCAGTYTGDEIEWDRHPYSAYTPANGWRMIVGQRAGDTNYFARAVVHHDTRKVGAVRKTFVRTYESLPSDSSDMARTCMNLTAWLKDNGYEHVNRWPDYCQIDMNDHPCEDGPLVPYLDGNHCGITGDGYIVDTDDDECEWKCDNTDGSATPKEESFDAHCRDCGAGIDFDSDDYINVGDGHVCEHCSDSYTLVRGQRTRWEREYYVRNSDAAEIVDADGYTTGESMDTEYPLDDYVQVDHPRHGTVYCDGGDAVCDPYGDYHCAHDERIVSLARSCPDSGADHCLEDDAQEIDGEYYSPYDDTSDVEGGEDEDEATTASTPAVPPVPAPARTPVLEYFCGAKDTPGVRVETVKAQRIMLSPHMRALYHLDKLTFDWVMENMHRSYSGTGDNIYQRMVVKEADLESIGLWSEMPTPGNNTWPVLYQESEYLLRGEDRSWMDSVPVYVSLYWREVVEAPAAPIPHPHTPGRTVQPAPVIV